MWGLLNAWWPSTHLSRRMFMISISNSVCLHSHSIDFAQLLETVVNTHLSDGYRLVVSAIYHEHFCMSCLLMFCLNTLWKVMGRGNCFTEWESYSSLFQYWWMNKSEPPKWILDVLSFRFEIYRVDKIIFLWYEISITTAVSRDEYVIVTLIQI